VRVNQSIQAFLYCILGSQVNVRSSILGSSGSAREVRCELLVLIEDAIEQPDISKSVQRFQFAIQEAKVKLDLAITPGTWLMPSHMIINTESMVGHNNGLKRANSNMKLGVNLDVNIEQKSVGIKHNSGTSKVELPHTTSSQSVKESTLGPSESVKSNQSDKPLEPSQSEKSTVLNPQTQPDVRDEHGFNSNNELNLALITIGFAGLVW